MRVIGYSSFGKVNMNGCSARIVVFQVGDDCMALLLTASIKHCSIFEFLLLKIECKDHLLFSAWKG